MVIAPVYAAILALLLSTHQSQEGNTMLTAMTFNLRYGTANDGDNSWPNRDHLVMDIFRERNADIVGVQEALAFQLDEITARFSQYAVIGVGRTDGKTTGEYAAILYNTQRFNVDASGTFWLSDTPNIVGSTSWGNTIPRICTWARLIDRNSGQAVYIFNAHFDHRSQPSREQSSILIEQRIAERTHDDPVVLMGDFNAGESNEAIATLNNNPDLVHSYRSIHPDATSIGTFNGFEGTSDGEMIDHIFVSSDVIIRDADIDRTSEKGRYPSDHFPVWATIEFKPSEG